MGQRQWVWAAACASAWALSGCSSDSKADGLYSGPDSALEAGPLGDSAFDGPLMQADGNSAEAQTAADSSLPAETGPEGDADGAGPDSAAQLLGCNRGEYRPYFGNLHAHTGYSDGKLTPGEAFAYGRDTAGLDILVITDHLEQLYWPSPLDRYGKCRQQAQEQTRAGSFLADCGFEYGTGVSLQGLSSTGHGNVFFSDGLFPAIQTDFHDFYQTLGGCPQCVGQFNHPGDQPGQTWNQFAFEPGVFAQMALFEFNGAGPAWELYFVALDNGWRLSPDFNQDNHDANWGTANDGRSGLFLDGLSRTEIAKAMVERRSFASQDKNAWISLLAEDQCWMGSVLQGRSTLALTVTAEDRDSAEGFSQLELYGPHQELLASFACQGSNPCQANFSLDVSGPTYALSRAVQTDGNWLISAPIWGSP